MNANDFGAYSQFGIIASTVCGKRWELANIDGSLKHAVVHCLEILGAVFLAAHFKDAKVAIWCASPRARLSHREIEKLNEEIRVAVNGCLEIRAGVKEIDDYYLSTWVSNVQKEGVIIPDYCALAFRRKDMERIKEHRDRTLNERSRSATYVIFEALRQRTDLFLPFPPRVSERYWEDAVTPKGANSVLRPPWTAGAPLATVSLSFDLRKSTFCMENADSPENFSTWIDHLVRILTSIAHSQGGVFDKFTGDGALVHFLERECQEVYGKVAVVAALECAIGMQRATSRHLEKLREFLRQDSEKLGGAIGIDEALAHWSLDHRNNPIVVGRGVVGACRLGDGTPAGRIRLTNITYRRLLSAGGGKYPFQSVAFTSKEFSKEMKLIAWELEAALISSGPFWSWSDKVGDEVYGV